MRSEGLAAWGLCVVVELAACGGHEHRGTSLTADSRDAQAMDGGGAGGSRGAQGAGGRSAPANSIGGKGGVTVGAAGMAPGGASADAAVDEPGSPDASSSPSDAGMVEPDAAGPDATIPDAGIADLVGTYDLHFGAAPVQSTHECAAVFPETAARFLVGSLHCGVRYTCPRTGIESPGILSDAVSAKAFRRTARTAEWTEAGEAYAHESHEHVLRLVLDTDENGFTGTGTATIERGPCLDSGGPIVFDVPVTIGPDVTPPVLTVSSYFAPYLVSWGEVRIESTEPVVDLSGTLSSTFGLESVTLPRVDTAVQDATSMWYAVQVVDPASVAGTSQRLFLKRPLTDTVGNAAAASPLAVPFANDAVVDPLLDFDTAPVAVMNAAYGHASVIDGAPCESGNCLMLGPIEPCHQHDGPTFFSLRFHATEHLSVKVRYNVLSTTARPAGYAVYVDDLDYINSYLPRSWPLPARPVPYGDLGYETGFRDVSTTTQSATPRGGAFAFACDEGVDSESVALVIESVEVVSDPSN